MDNLFDSGGVLAQFLSIGVMWDPSCGLACRDLGHHLINLLKRQSLGLRHEEVSKDDADCTGGAPKEEDLRTKVGFVLSNKVRRDNGNDAVPITFISLYCGVRGRRKLTRTS
jgi:hypothetical protein